MTKKAGIIQELFNSLFFGCGCDFAGVILKHKLAIDVSSISCETSLEWMLPQPSILKLALILLV